MTDKICNRCNLNKDLSHYNKRSYWNTYYNVCKSCASIKANESVIKKYGTYRNANLIKIYGITSDDYDQMYEKQKGKCLICERERTLVIDHCHTTGKIRGLLCTGCNTGLGLFQDGALFAKAKEYLS